MKKIILLFITVSIVGIWFFIDRKMFFYGENIISHQLLPEGIYPESRYDFENGFTIHDKYGFSLLAKGFPLSNNSKENVKDILEYGYNKVSILTLIKTETNKTMYVQIKSNKKSRTNLDIDVFTEKIGNKKRDKYKWINIHKGVPYPLERLHTLLVPLLIILFLSWIFILLILLKKRI